MGARHAVAGAASQRHRKLWRSSASRQVPDEAKEEFLRRVVEQPAPLVWNFLRLLTERSRLGLLPHIVEAFQELADEERGVAHAQVVTAVALSDEEQTAPHRGSPS